MNWARGLLMAVFLLLLLPIGGGAAGEKRVAVLELVNKAGISDDEAYLLTDMVRDAASATLANRGFLIITRESLLELMPPGKDLSKCLESSCEVQIGREIGADYLVTGELIKFGGELRANLKAHHSQSGAFLGAEVAKGANINDMENAIKASATVLFAKVLAHAGVSAAAGGGAVFVTPGQPTGPAGAAELREIAPTAAPSAAAEGPARLYITSNPPGAEVYLGTLKAGTASPAYQSGNLQAGQRIHVTLKLPLYHDVSFDVDLKSGFSKFENVALKPAFGSLTIESEPSGAKVSIGGQEVGTTPYTNPRYPSGDYLVSLEKEWYAPLPDQTLSVRDGESAKKSFTLSQDFGTLEVASNPSGAEVTLNGKKLGATPASFRVAPVKNGKLEINLATYRGKSFAISIDRGQTVKITAAQATLVAKVGALDVSADPPEPGAKVFLDSKEVGTAPLTLNEIREGTHEVKVETKDKAGAAKVSVTEGQTAVATVKLASRGVAGLVRIEAGRFQMGSPGGEPGRFNDETQHWVTISKPLLLGATEVTQGQWKKLMGSNPSKFASCGDDCPVEQVSWNDAVDFCNRLSDQEGLSRCYSGTGNAIEWDHSCTGYRLPTEAEWECAARAGSASALCTGPLTIRGEHNGPELDGIAWYGGNSGVSYSGGSDCSGWKDKQYSSSSCGTHPVARKQGNSLGLYDMMGNVWEWVWDWKGDYSSGSVTDPTGASGGSDRVFRGGGWINNARGCRSANRHGLDPGDRSFYLGFRIARSLP